MELAGDVALDGGRLDLLLETGERGPRLGRLVLERGDLGLELGQMSLGIRQRLRRGLGLLPRLGDGLGIGDGRRGGNGEHADAERGDDESPDGVDASPHNGARP
jgi:hypothetical protein